MKCAVVDGKGAPAAPTTALSLATVLSLSTTLSFLSSRAKPSDLQFSSSASPVDESESADQL
jgi:hypothetical protein